MSMTPRQCRPRGLLLIAALIGAGSVLSATAAAADADSMSQPHSSATHESSNDTARAGKAPITENRVKQILIKDGFSQIAGIHARADHWEGRGIEDGVSYRFRVDSQSGELSKTRIAAPDN